MPSIEIALRCILPRWTLSSDPHVVVDGAPPARLTRRGCSFSVQPGAYAIEVVPFGRADDNRWNRRGRVTRWEADVAQAESISLRFHPAPLQSYMRRGWIWRSSRPLRDPLTAP